MPRQRTSVEQAAYRERMAADRKRNAQCSSHCHVSDLDWADVLNDALIAQINGENQS